MFELRYVFIICSKFNRSQQDGTRTQNVYVNHRHRVRQLTIVTLLENVPLSFSHDERSSSIIRVLLEQHKHRYCLPLSHTCRVHSNLFGRCKAYGKY